MVTPGQGQALSPHAVYEAELWKCISELSPASLLDVGCGDGALLRRATAADISRCIGLEIDPVHVAGLVEQGLEVVVGKGEQLPLRDGEVDVVVMQYSAHHMDRLDLALGEAARVARCAVVVLDPWYDLEWPSQRTAQRFDNWLKTIDRICGMIHNACPTAAELSQAFENLGGFRLAYAHLRVVAPLDLAWCETLAERQLERVDDNGDLRRAFGEIRKAVQLDGLSQDGAILFRATRIPAS